MGPSIANFFCPVKSLFENLRFEKFITATAGKPFQILVQLGVSKVIDEERFNAQLFEYFAQTQGELSLREILGRQFLANHNYGFGHLSHRAPLFSSGHL